MKRISESWTFYDLFDVFYPQIYHRKIPWQSGKNAGNSTVYGIPSKEFESVIQEFLNVKTDILAQKNDLPGER